MKNEILISKNQVIPIYVFNILFLYLSDFLSEFQLLSDIFILYIIRANLFLFGLKFKSSLGHF